LDLQTTEISEWEKDKNVGLANGFRGIIAELPSGAPLASWEIKGNP